MSDKMSEVEAAKKAVLVIFPEAYARDTKRGGFDIIDVIDKDQAMSIGYGKTEGAAWIDAASRQGHVSTPVGELEGAFEYVRKPQMPVRAVKWTGDNIEEVRKVYPHLGEEYMRDKGCGLGHYVICPYPGRVYFQDAASFEETYTRAALSSKPAPEGIPERFSGIKECAEACKKENRFVQVSGSEMLRILDELGRSQAIVSALKSDISSFGEGDIAAQNIVRIIGERDRAEADLLEARCGLVAWESAVSGLESHLQDRISMRDQSNPQRYLEILQSDVATVRRDTEQIRAATWHRENCYRQQAESAEAMVATRDAEIERLSMPRQILCAYCRNHKEEQTDSGWTYMQQHISICGARLELNEKGVDLLKSLMNEKTAAEAELASLKLSSAKVREEGKADGLRAAAAIVSGGTYSGDYPNSGTDAQDNVCRWASARILSLLPTLPESQEAGQ